MEIKEFATYCLPRFSPKIIQDYELGAQIVLLDLDLGLSQHHWQVESRWLITVFRRKKIKILKSLKLKIKDVSCEVLVTAIDHFRYIKTQFGSEA